MTVALAVDLDWREFTLGELLSLSNGVNADKSAYGAGVPFANILEIITHESIAEPDIPGRIRIDSNTARRYGVTRGDILFNRTSETQDEVGLASVFVGTRPVVFGGFVFRGRPLTNELTLEYSRYAFRSQPVRTQIIARGQGAIRANIGQRDLRTVKVRLPGRSEQLAIAQALDDASAFVSSLGRMIAKKEAIKQGMMQHLLTGRTRLPGFTDHWSSSTLGALGAFLRGRGVKREDVRSAGIRCIRYGELYTAFADYTSAVRSFVPPHVAAAALPLRTGDVLFAGSGETREEIGKCVAYIGATPTVAGGDVIVLRGDKFNPVYLALLVNSAEVVTQKARAGQGDAVVHIYGSALAAIDVTMPPPAEQDAIAEVIMDADREIAVLRVRLAKARGIRLGMMQELLTGRTRLPALESATA